MAFELIEALLEKCSYTDEVGAWSKEEENEEELADALLGGELDVSEMKWRVYAALERLDLLNTTALAVWRSARPRGASGGGVTAGLA